jgi:hypothetical protein
VCDMRDPENEINRSVIYRQQTSQRLQEYFGVCTSNEMQVDD